MSDSNRPSLPRLGFIGLGGMGSRMASRLLATGYQVTVYNRTSDRSVAVKGLGVSITTTTSRAVAVRI